MRNLRNRKQLWKAAGALFLSASLALSASVSYLPANQEVYAAEVQADENGFVIEDGVLTKYTGTATEVVIPEGVTSIGEEAFRFCRNITSISIPDSVTSIGRFAFRECRSLISVNIPNGVTNIEDYTFSHCECLTSVSIPNSVTSIGSFAFRGCHALTSITIPEGVTSIGEGAFWGCSDITSITIPKGITSIESQTFSGCSITSITIPDSVTSIGYSAFAYTDITSITIPKGVTSISSKESVIGDSGYAGIVDNCSDLISIVVEEGNPVYDSRGNCNAIIETSSNTLIAGCKNTIIPNNITTIEGMAFRGCSGLTEITIPNSVISIRDGAFAVCTSLTSITIPDSVTSIGEYAFGDCTSLTSIKLPNNLPDITWHLFGGCTSLTSITIPDGVTRIGFGAFVSCHSLTNITLPDSVTEIEGDAFAMCSSLTNVNLSSNLTSIGYGAFGDCSSLVNITLPNSVTSIGEGAFDGCALSGITVAEGNTVYDSRENCNAIIETSSNTLIAGCSKTTIPDSVTSIGAYAFTGRRGLTGIIVPNSVTSIGDGAFGDCDLSSITVAEGNTVYDSRGNCNAIIETSSNKLIAGSGKTVIPNSVTSIGAYAFSGRSGLVSITIPNSVTNIGYGAFSACSGLDSIVVEKGNSIYDSRGDCNAIIETEGNTLIVGCNKTVIPDGVTSIGAYAFTGRRSLTSIIIPEGVTSIRSSAFGDCTSLISITIPNSVTDIGYGAFSNCDKLVIYGEEGSYAQTYAQSHHIPFRVFGEQDILALETMNQLIEENEKQDTIIQTADGLTFTFKKGTMELLDGMDIYDFGAEITEDYAALPNPEFAEEEFAFRINFYHSGQLPGEAEIIMPAGSKWAGKKLYYYEIKEDGTYSYVCRSAVAADGSYTVKQSHCSSYVATTKVPEDLGNCDGKEGIMSSDALAVLRYEVGIDQTDFDARFADCDGKEGITSSDALAILRYEVNVIDALE